MLQAPERYRCLDGPEKILVRDSLALVLELVEDDDCWQFGIAAFDRLPPGHKLALLAATGMGLLRTGGPPLRRAPDIDAAITLLYSEIGTLVRMEIEQPARRSQTWRRLLCEACRHGGALRPPPLLCDDAAQWDRVIAFLTDRTMPHARHLARARMWTTSDTGGDENEPRAIHPHDLGAEELERARRTLDELVGSSETYALENI